CWVSGYNGGFFSSTNLVYPDGTIHRLNTALVTSCDIDSDGDGIVNCMDPTPIFTASSLALSVSLTNSPQHSAALAWNSVPYSTNYVYYKNSMGTTNWQVLTNFVLGATGGRIKVTDPMTSSGRLYRVRVDPPR